MFRGTTYIHSTNISPGNLKLSTALGVLEITPDSVTGIHSVSNSIFGGGINEGDIIVPIIISSFDSFSVSSILLLSSVDGLGCAMAIVVNKKVLI